MFVLEKNRSRRSLLKGWNSRATSQTFVPVIGGLGAENIGVQYLVDAVVDYSGEPAGHSAGKEWSRHARTDGAPYGQIRKFLLAAFKLWRAIVRKANSFSSVFTPARLSKGE